ncbi:MAG: segregation/condensation protein A [Oscillospiraceae bacterium]|jgi:segregation and condensation protein A|nr:segregation/condensation protein A [Oscillospiraceae bacterium]
MSDFEPEFYLPEAISGKQGAEDFTGPLFLILQLLSQNKMQIRDISVSRILEQFQTWIAERVELNLNVASEFIAMASQLMLIKSKMLVGEADPPELAELVSSLEALRKADVYERLLKVLPSLADMQGALGELYVHPPEMIAPDLSYNFPHMPDELFYLVLDIYRRKLETLTNEERAKTAYPQLSVYPIDSKIDEIHALLRSGRQLTVAEIFSRCSSRSELIATFVAILEMCSDGQAAISEDLMTLAKAEKQKADAI